MHEEADGGLPRGALGRRMAHICSFHAKTNVFLEFYKAFWWGCQEVHKTHNFGVPRNHLSTIQKKKGRK